MQSLPPPPNTRPFTRKYRVRPLRMGLDKCYTPHFQCQSATSKRKTLLRLTETEHISFVSVMPLYSNSNQNYTFHNHSVPLSVLQIATTTDYYLNRQVTTWKRNNTTPQTTVTTDYLHTDLQLHGNVKLQRSRRPSPRYW